MELPERAATFCRRLGIEHPIVQAPMGGGMVPPELAAAVAAAGALGSLAGGMRAPQEIGAQIREVRARTNRPFAINLFALPAVAIALDDLQRAYDRLAPWRRELRIAGAPPETFAPDGDAQFAAALAERPPALSFTFGAFSKERTRALREANVFTIATATTLDEARLLRNAGADAIVAQGAEAGGHRGTFLGDAREAMMPTLDLVERIAAEIDAPTIAAGGIMDGAQIAQALQRGAAAVQLGTAFLACDEAGTHPLHVAALTAPGSKTIVTRTATGKYARGIRNAIFGSLDPIADAIPAYPVQNALTKPIRAAAAAAGRPDLMVMLAGTGHRAVRPMPAADLVATLARELAQA